MGFHNTLFIERRKSNMTQKELANKIGVDFRLISNWETGRTKPSPQNMQKIEDFFGVKKEKIFFELFKYDK